MLLANATDASDPAASTRSRRSRLLANGIAPEPRMTSPSGRSARTRARILSPNDVASGGPETMATSAAPAVRNASPWRCAMRARSAASHRPRTPARGPASGCKIRTVTGRMARSLAAVREVTEMPQVGRVRAYIGLGANVGDAASTLAEAVGALAALPGGRVRAVSQLYVTTPVGVTDQPDFHNAVVALDVPAGPDAAIGALDLLAKLKDLEREFGRQRRRRWGPRELDLDILVFGRARLKIERSEEARSIDAETDPAKASRLLEVPHASAAARLFVLAPLAELAPGLVPPGWGTTVESARRRAAATEPPDAVRPIATWDATAGG